MRWVRFSVHERQLVKEKEKRSPHYEAYESEDLQKVPRGKKVAPGALSANSQPFVVAARKKRSLCRAYFVVHTGPASALRSNALLRIFDQPVISAIQIVSIAVVVLVAPSFALWPSAASTPLFLSRPAPASEPSASSYLSAHMLTCIFLAHRECRQRSALVLKRSKARKPSVHRRLLRTGRRAGRKRSEADAEGDDAEAGVEFVDDAPRGCRRRRIGTLRLLR